MTDINETLTNQISELVGQWSIREKEQIDWLSGTFDGGPNSDGEYPLTDIAGSEVLVACPARFAYDFGVLTGDIESEVVTAAQAAQAALLSATEAAANATETENWYNLANTIKTDIEALEASVTGLKDTAVSASNTAVTSATNASSSALSASDSADKAELWAEELEDVEVETGMYSAKHYATKAQALIDSVADVSNQVQLAEDHAANAAQSALDASSHADALGVSALAASSHAALAVIYAENDEDEEIQAGEYSAKHYKLKAEQSALDASASKASAESASSSATSSASAASTSETNASNSASTATTQAGIASSSASSASTSATSASTSATNAATSATDSEASRVASALSATTATTKASEAGASATNAAQSASDATNSAALATNKASEASGYASSAEGYKIAAVFAAEDAQTTYNNVVAAVSATTYTPTFVNGWQNYGSGYQPLKFTKINGVITAEGLIANPTFPNPINFTSAICFLPVGFRPTGSLVTAQYCNGGAARIDILTTGEVRAEISHGAYQSINVSWVVA